MVNISDINGVVNSLKLGGLSAAPRRLTGGLSHTAYQINTDHARFVLKILNPTIMQRPEAPDNYRRSEALAQLLSDEISAVAAIPFQNDVLIPFEGNIYMRFPFVPGKTLTHDEITPAHCAKIGEVLGRIHARKITMPESTVSECPLYSWQDSGLTGKESDHLDRINQQANDALMLLHHDSVMSHRDLDSKNVLWDGETPHVIDWEAAGMIHPALELWECFLNWCVDSSGDIFPERVHALFQAYRKFHRLQEIDWNIVSSGGYAGMLGWLNYNLIRSSSQEIPSEERTLGKEQVAQTLRELFAYESKRNKFVVMVLGGDWL